MIADRFCSLTPLDAVQIAEELLKYKAPKSKHQAPKKLQASSRIRLMFGAF